MSIKIEGMDRVLRLLNSLERVQDALFPAMYETVYDIQQDVATPPPPPTGGPYGFKSDKQRRWFFWAKRVGKSGGGIDVPYVRTDKLKNSWTTRVTRTGAGLRGVVGTNTEYAPWVVSDEAVDGSGPQAKIHQNRWQTAQDVQRKYNEIARQRFSEVIEKLLNGVGI